MNTPIIIERQVHFNRRGKGSRKELELGAGPPKPEEPGRVPRVARLMALAIRFENLLRAGEVRHQAELARLGHVTRARVSQIMSLVHLSPPIQEALLFLPRTVQGRDPLQLRDLLPLVRVADWKKQWTLWQRLATSGMP